MALVPATGIHSYLQTDTRIVDISDVLAMMIIKDTNLLSLIQWGEDVTDREYKWVNDKMNPQEVTQSGAIDNVVVTLPVAVGHGARVRIGTLLQDVTAGKTEIVQITAIAGDSLTVARGYGSTSPETHADGALWQVIAMPKQEGAEPEYGGTTNRWFESNYTQIFERALRITRTMMGIQSYGVSDEFNYQIEKYTQDVQRELSRTVLRGVKNVGNPTDSYRTMGGIIEFINATGGNINTTAEPLTMSVINDMCQMVFDDGGLVTHLVLPAALFRKVQTFGESYLQITQSETSYGRTVQQLITDLGWKLDLVLDRDMPVGTALFLDVSRISLHAFVNGHWAWSPLPTKLDGGRAKESALVGEFTMKVLNPLEAHAIHTNLS